MKHAWLIVPLALCAGCERGPEVSAAPAGAPPKPVVATSSESKSAVAVLVTVREFGGSAPDAPPGGLALILWDDGVALRSRNFPYFGATFDVLKLDKAGAADLARRVESSIATCADEHLAAPETQDFQLVVNMPGAGRRAGSLPYYVLNKTSNRPPSPCIDEVRLLMASMGALAASDDKALRQVIETRRAAMP